MKYSFRDNTWETLAKNFPKGFKMPKELHIYDGKKGEETLVAVFILDENILDYKESV